MIVMGLDLSLTSTGVVVVDTKKKKRMGKVLYSKALQYDYKGMDRLIMIREGIRGIIERFRPEEVVLEGYSYGSKFNREILGELGGIVKAMLWEKAIPFRIIAPTTLKKFITGNGRAKKKELKSAVKEKYDEEFKTDDEADAFALCMMEQK